MTAPGRSGILENTGIRKAGPMNLSRRSAAAAPLLLPAGRAFGQGMPPDAEPIDETPTEVPSGRDAFEHIMAPAPPRLKILSGTNPSGGSRCLCLLPDLSLGKCPKKTIKLNTRCAQLAAMPFQLFSPGGFKPRTRAM